MRLLSRPQRGGERLRVMARERARTSLRGIYPEESALQDPETFGERLDALHPLPSDILTNSGAPRADNYFRGPRGPRLPRVFIYPGPHASAAFTTRSSLPSPSHFSLALSRRPRRARRFFVLKAARPFCAFLRGPEGPTPRHATAAVGKG